MKKKLQKMIALAMVCTFAVSNIAFAGGASIGHGNISVYKSGKLVSKLSGQNPVQDGALLECAGKCMIKSEGITLVGADKAKVAVSNEEETFKLYIQEGEVQFIINNNVRQIAFYTPQGTYTVADVVFNASSKSAVKGKVTVDANGETKISVTEGRMVFATTDGMKTVDANNTLVLAVQGPQAQVQDTGNPLTPVIFTSLALLTGGGLLLAGQNDNDDDGDDGTTTPVTPTPTPTPTTPPPTPASPAI